MLSAEFGGIFTTSLCERRTKVAKGQTLARVDDGGLSFQLAQMETQAALAKTTFERQENLWKQKLVLKFNIYKLKPIIMRN